MHHRPRRFADPRGVVDADAAELADQDVLHLQSHHGGVTVTRQIHQAGHEVRERVGPHEQQGAAARAEVDHRHGHVEQTAGVEREQLGARNRLDDVEQQLAGVARVAVRQRQRVVHPARHQRDVEHVGVHRRDGEQSDEPVLDGFGAVLAGRPGLFPDDDDLRIGAVAQEAGDGGLRQRQDLPAGGQLRQHIVAQPQHAQATSRVDGRLAAAHSAPLIPEKHEVTVGQPPQQRGDVLAVRAREPSSGVAVEFGGQATQRRGHVGGVDGNLAGVGERARQQPLGLLDGAPVGRRGQLDVHPGLVDAVAELGLGRGGDVEQFTVRPATYAEQRIHDRAVGHAEAVQQHRHRIHQQRGVVGDDLQRRTETAGVVGPVHRDPGGAGRPLPAEAVLSFDQGRVGHRPGRRPAHRAGHRGLGPRCAAMRPPVGLEVRGRQPFDDP